MSVKTVPGKNVVGIDGFNYAFTKAIDLVLEKQYLSYDPYDGASSTIPIIRNHYYTRLISTYFNKFSPINIRPLLDIRPTMQNMALGFIGRAMLVEFEKYKTHLENMIGILVKNSLIEQYGYHCWEPHGFSIQMRGSLKEVGMTSIIGNEAIGRFFLDLFKESPDEQYRDICISIRDYFLIKFFVEYGKINFFKYRPVTPENQWCYNASVIAAAYISTVSNYFNLSYDRDKVEAALKDVVTRQKENGEWWYSLNLDSGYEKKQIDFHQGFILDAILEYMLSNSLEETFIGAYKKGLIFYYKNQFLRNGQGIYRYPKKWPVNIHNQAQGIITFSRAAEAGFGDEYLDFARTIAEWTIKNMQDPDGHFYYMKFPLFTNKIPYIRWSDAAMAYALAVLNVALNTDNSTKS